MLDVKITGGTIIDGTSTAGYRGGVGIKNGRIVAVGTVGEPAGETIDATGRVVSPGFIDNHTHYDAQAFWDPTFSPSCYHGVTTIVGGFCGFSIAPLSPQSADYIKPMLARVEGMPLETLEAAVPCDWSSFGEFLDRIEGRVGLNAGFFAGHSAIRRVVMNERAVGEKASAADVEAMKALLDRCLAEGALGLSTTVSRNHIDADGKPVPSRWADRSEFIELASVVARHEGTGLEMLPDVEFPDGMAEFMADFSIAGNRPLNWNVLAITGRPDAADLAERQLAVSDVARARGGEVIALTLPSAPEAHLTLRIGPPLDTLPGAWNKLFKLSIPERIERLKDPAVRTQLAADADSVLGSNTYLEFVARVGDLKLVATRTPAWKKHEGRRLKDIAEEEGERPIDVLFDIAIADDLRTIFSIVYGGADRASYELRGRIWADDRTLIGASDAGAHLEQSDTFAFSTSVLQTGVREQKIISLEEAIHQLTQRPATYFGLVDRGTIAVGQYADLVIFDPDRIGRGPTCFRHDLPATDAFRLYAEATGIDHVFVNGVAIVNDGHHSGALPGIVLRSGRDTRTVRMDALRNKRGALAPA